MLAHLKTSKEKVGRWWEKKLWHVTVLIGNSYLRRSIGWHVAEPRHKFNVHPMQCTLASAQIVNCKCIWTNLNAYVQTVCAKCIYINCTCLYCHQKLEWDVEVNIVVVIFCYLHRTRVHIFTWRKTKLSNSVPKWKKLSCQGGLFWN